MKRNILLPIILIITVSCNLYGQKSDKKYFITGKITDSSGAPVSGAVVLIDNQKTDIISDSRGTYRVKVRPDATRIAVFKLMNGLGEEEINGRTTIDFALTGGSSSEVSGNQEKRAGNPVNVGYGNVSQKELTTNVGKIDGQSKKYASYQTIYDMIRGEVPGVQVSGTRITIQGITSINSATDPLLVVNGIIVSSIDDINPQMVDSIEILKGSAASIYGARGANGVVIITLTGSERK